MSAKGNNSKRKEYIFFLKKSSDRVANQSQILCGVSICKRNECLLMASGSHDQDGRHVHIW